MAEAPCRPSLRCPVSIVSWAPRARTLGILSPIGNTPGGTLRRLGRLVLTMPRALARVPPALVDGERNRPAALDKVWGNLQRSGSTLKE